MVRSDDLLRMLEPAVRPGNVAPPRQPFVPVEQRDFESLLEEARRLGLRVAEVLAVAASDSPTVFQRSDGPQSSPPAFVGASPLSPLAGLERIENRDVRQLLTARSLPNASDATQGIQAG